MAEDPRNTAMRARIVDRLVKGSENSLDVAFDLGGILSEEVWRGFTDHEGVPFPSFAAYISHDLSKYVSRSHAYALAKMGAHMRAAADDVRRLVRERKVGLNRLLQLAKHIEAGKARVHDVVDAVDNGEILPCEKEAQRDPEEYESFTLMVKRGDGETVRRGLLLHAIRGGYQTFDEAFADLAIGEAADATVPPYAAKYQELIERDEFRCELCGKIPRQPTGHHVIPQSIAQGEGPISLLCWACHKPVQRNWPAWGEKKLGKKKFAELLQSFKSRGGLTGPLNETIADCCANLDKSVADEEPDESK